MDLCFLWHTDIVTIFNCALCSHDWLKCAIRVICVRLNLTLNQYNCIGINIRQLYRIKYDYVCGVCNSVQYHCSVHWCENCVGYSCKRTLFPHIFVGKCKLCDGLLNEYYPHWIIIRIKQLRYGGQTYRACPTCMHRCSICKRIFDTILLRAIGDLYNFQLCCIRCGYGANANIKLISKYYRAIPVQYIYTYSILNTHPGN